LHVYGGLASDGGEASMIVNTDVATLPVMNKREPLMQETILT
jgi:hypothetical protein